MIFWIKKFRWDSLDQIKGHKAFLSWAKNKGVSNKVKPIDLFFIQKDFESNVYWRELIGDQVSRLENSIQQLQIQVRRLQMKAGEIDA